MTVIARPLVEGDPWQIVYNTNTRELFVQSNSHPRQLTINEFLASEPTTSAAMVLEGLIIDMFPNSDDDADEE
jgi:hypothetical protein